MIRAKITKMFQLVKVIHTLQNTVDSVSGHGVYTLSRVLDSWPLTCKFCTCGIS